MFVILQKYDFSSKSQRNSFSILLFNDVCDTAKVRFFKQITTIPHRSLLPHGCLWYCKSTIFQANHNRDSLVVRDSVDVCDTAKVRFFKQITTPRFSKPDYRRMFVILQKYDFSSKSQPDLRLTAPYIRCLWYCKSTIFQANHNTLKHGCQKACDVCDTAKVRFFKQITTDIYVFKYVA